MENSYKFFENKDCEYYPCHKGLDHINCLFCYCPLYSLEDCPGTPQYSEKNGKKIKVCTNCTFSHNPDNYERVMEEIKKKIIGKEKDA